MWSCGCILAEMLGRHPLFPGKNFVHQLTLVFDVIGCPTPKEYKHVVNHEALKFLHAQGNKQRTPFSEVYPTMSTDATDMLEAILIFNPAKRATVDEALRMPYMLGVGLPKSLEFPPISEDFDFSFEHNPQVTRYQLKQAIAAEVASFKKEIRLKQSGGSAGGGAAAAAAESSRPASTRINNSGTASDSQQQQAEVFSKESSSHSSSGARGEGRKEPVPVPAAAATASDKGRAVSAPRLRGANSSAAQAAAAAPEVSNATATQATSSRRISMKPPVFYQQHPKKASTAASATTDNKLSSSQGIAQQSHASRIANDASDEDESDSDAYDKLFQTRSTVTGSKSDSAKAGGLAGGAVISAPSSSVSAVMERIAKIVESSSAENNGHSHTPAQPSSMPTPSVVPKSPAKSLRYHPPTDMGPLPEKTGFEYKSMDLEDMLRSSVSGGRGGAGQSGAGGVRASSTAVAAVDSVGVGASTTANRLASSQQLPGGLSNAASVGATAAAGAASPGRRSIMDTYLSPRRIVVGKDRESSGRTGGGLGMHSGDSRDEGPSGPLPRSSVALSPPAPAAPPTAAASGAARANLPLYDSMLGRFEDKFNLSNRLQQVDRDMATASAAAVEKPRGDYSRTLDSSVAGQLKSSVLPSPPKAQTASVRASRDVRRSESKYADEEKHRDSDESETEADILAARRLLREYAQPIRQQQQLQQQQEQLRQEQQRFNAAQATGDLLRDRGEFGHTGSRKSEQQPQQFTHTRHEYPYSSAVPDRDNNRRVSEPQNNYVDEEESEDERDQHHNRPKEQKKKFTVARSPKFSTMSWQRKGSDGGGGGGAAGGGAGAAGGVGDKKRANSTLRNVPSAAHLDNEYESALKGAAAAAAAVPPAPPAKPVKVPSYAVPTASQMLKTNNPVRSESAHRMRK